MVDFDYLETNDAERDCEYDVDCIANRKVRKRNAKTYQEVEMGWVDDE